MQRNTVLWELVPWCSRLNHYFGTPMYYMGVLVKGSGYSASKPDAYQHIWEVEIHEFLTTHEGNLGAILGSWL